MLGCEEIDVKDLTLSRPSRSYWRETFFYIVVDWRPPQERLRMPGLASVLHKSHLDAKHCFC